MKRDEAFKGDIERFVNDPVFERVIEAFQRLKLAQISSHESTGENDAILLEWCRELKTINKFKATLKNDLSRLSERDN